MHSKAARRKSRGLEPQEVTTAQQGLRHTPCTPAQCTPIQHIRAHGMPETRRIIKQRAASVQPRIWRTPWCPRLREAADTTSTPCRGIVWVAQPTGHVLELRRSTLRGTRLLPASPIDSPQRAHAAQPRPFVQRPVKAGEALAVPRGEQRMPPHAEGDSRAWRHRPSRRGHHRASARASPRRPEGATNPQQEQRQTHARCWRVTATAPAQGCGEPAPGATPDPRPPPTAYQPHATHAARPGRVGFGEIGARAKGSRRVEKAVSAGSLRHSKPQPFETLR